MVQAIEKTKDQPADFLVVKIPPWINLRMARRQLRPVAAETEKADDSVATANARDAVIVNAIMNSPMNSSKRTKAVMDYLQSRQASDYQPRSQNYAG
ncbi:TPA: hypothetical protein ACH3X1_002225 [Trebouxia sp. C0004]